MGGEVCVRGAASLKSRAQTHSLSVGRSVHARLPPAHPFVCLLRYVNRICSSALERREMELGVGCHKISLQDDPGAGFVFRSGHYGVRVLFTRCYGTHSINHLTGIIAFFYSRASFLFTGQSVSFHRGR
jgi:hypothetical protein